MIYWPIYRVFSKPRLYSLLHHSLLYLSSVLFPPTLPPATPKLMMWPISKHFQQQLSPPTPPWLLILSHQRTSPLLISSLLRLSLAVWLRPLLLRTPSSLPSYSSTTPHNPQSSADIHLSKSSLLFPLSPEPLSFYCCTLYSQCRSRLHHNQKPTKS